MNILESKPVWQEYKLPQYRRLQKAQRFDVVVVGGGTTGLSTALFLKEAGKTVCVLERGRIGQGETGHTTAHLTCVTDVRLAQLVRAFGEEQAALAWYAGLTALELIEQVVTNYEIDCEFRRTPGYLHAALDGENDETDALRSEADLARELGIDAAFVSEAPIVGKPAMLIRNQAKVHPAAYVAGLARAVDGDGSAIYEQTEVAEIESDPLAVMANGFRINCDYVVIATHVPLMGKSGLLKASALQTKLASYSSYVVSGKLPHGVAPDVSLWDTGNPYYYLRCDAGAKYDRIIFGGKDHKTGQQEDTEACYKQLETMLLRLLPTAKLDHRWSGQVISTPDGLPYIGESSDRQFVATGFNGNGITFGTIAGMMARDALLDRDNPWRELFSVERKPIKRGLWEYFRENFDYPYYLATDWLASVPKSRHAQRCTKRGEGKIVKCNGHLTACARDKDGQLHQVSAVCTHLGCLVRWNSAEQTWDCPCHGSRFLPDGKVIAGPAESPLEPIEKSPASKPEQAHIPQT